VYAENGTAQVEPQRFSLRLERGQIERLSFLDPTNVLHIRFRDYTMNIPLPSASRLRGQTWREMDFQQLRKEIRQRKTQGLPTGEAEAELHLRLAVALSPLALALLGIPLGMTLERGGRGIGFGASVGVLFVYYLLLIMGLNLAERGALPAMPALWIANGFMALVGLTLYWKRLTL
jgi:lipopolysaccharide export LptBFGC system permease protein LptF